MTSAVDTWSVVLALRPGVRFEELDGRLALRHPWGIVRVGLDLVPAVEALAAGAEPDDARVAWLARRLPFLVEHRLVVGGEELLRVTPIAAGSTFAPRVPEGEVALSRFAFLRRHERRLVLESPLSLERVVLADASLVDPEPGHPAVAYLVGAGLLVEGGDEPETDTWEFHDLLFHSRSRRGRHDYDTGATFRFLGSRDPLPAVEPPSPGPAIELHRPDLEAIAAREPSFTEVLESRRSVREYGERPMTAEQLGEFLCRAARVRRVYGPLPEQGMPYEASDRPYPTGGAGHDLELYVTVNRCDGVEPGIYRYDALGHRLVLVNDSAADRRSLSYEAWLSAGGQTVPDVLLTITSRFGRLQWKYAGIAYTTTIKHVGVLYQTMYLVATAMGLAPCGLGGGNVDVCARALHLDWRRESCVGEFMLGSRPTREDHG